MPLSPRRRKRITGTILPNKSPIKPRVLWPQPAASNQKSPSGATQVGTRPTADSQSPKISAAAVGPNSKAAGDDNEVEGNGQSDPQRFQVRKIAARVRPSDRMRHRAERDGMKLREALDLMALGTPTAKKGTSAPTAETSYVPTSALLGSKLEQQAQPRRVLTSEPSEAQAREELAGDDLVRMLPLPDLSLQSRPGLSLVEYPVRPILEQPVQSSDDLVMREPHSSVPVPADVVCKIGRLVMEEQIVNKLDDGKLTAWQFEERLVVLKVQLERASQKLQMFDRYNSTVEQDSEQQTCIRAQMTIREIEEIERYALRLAKHQTALIDEIEVMQHQFWYIQQTDLIALRQEAAAEVCTS